MLTKTIEPTRRETMALGYISAELAAKADAWNGNAPEWFPEPPEWLDLWQEALRATADELQKETPEFNPNVASRDARNLMSDIRIAYDDPGSGEDNFRISKLAASLEAGIEVLWGLVEELDDPGS